MLPSPHHMVRRNRGQGCRATMTLKHSAGQRLLTPSIWNRKKAATKTRKERINQLGHFGLGILGSTEFGSVIKRATPALKSDGESVSAESSCRKSFGAHRIGRRTAC